MDYSYLKRHAYLLSILEETNEFVSDQRSSIVHADSSFLGYQPGAANPWLSDVAQFEWLLLNYRQIECHGESKFIERIVVLRNGFDLPSWEAMLEYYATVKAVIHAQLFERVKTGVLFIANSWREDFSYSMVRGLRIPIAWPPLDFYGSVRSTIARRASSTEALSITTKSEANRQRVIWLAPYRDEHFVPGNRMTLPESWRFFLNVLHQGRCMACGLRVGEKGEIDHLRPLRPKVVMPAGNSTIFNLGLMCEEHNQAKRNLVYTIPEKILPKIVPHPVIRMYFLGSLQRSPGEAVHELPTVIPPIIDHF